MSKNNDTLIAFLAGAAAGAIVGVLFAPDKGKNTRDKLSFKLEKYKDTLQQLLEDVLEDKETVETAAKVESEKIVHDAKDKAEKLIEDVELLINQIRGKHG